MRSGAREHDGGPRRKVGGMAAKFPANSVGSSGLFLGQSKPVKPIAAMTSTEISKLMVSMTRAQKAETTRQTPKVPRHK
jgi:hypothetical protein